MPTVYVGLGSNLGDSRAMLNQALQQIKELPGVEDFAPSQVYRTTPVSAIAQDHYCNAVCRFHTSLSAKGLLDQLQQIEKVLGKTTVTEKNAPRLIDLDILLFGQEMHAEKELTIPHPRWMQRLFVLIPLLDLATELLIPDSDSPLGERYINLQEYVRTFVNSNHEQVSLYIEEVGNVSCPR